MAGGRPLVYLDSANTSQKPQVVIDTMVDHLERHNANIAAGHAPARRRGDGGLRAARDKVAAFIDAPSRDEVVFTKNASEALNLVANTLAWPRGDWSAPVGSARPGDEVVITEMEHHSNIVPWQLLHRAHRRDAAMVRADRRRSARPRRHRRPDHRADQGRLADLGLQHARHHQPGRRDRAPGPRGRCPGRRRRLARRCRSCPSTSVASGADVLVFTGHKMRRSDRDRRALGPA